MESNNIKHAQYVKSFNEKDKNGDTGFKKMVDELLIRIRETKKDTYPHFIFMIQRAMNLYGANPFIKNKQGYSAYYDVNDLLEDAQENPEEGIPTASILKLKEMFEEWFEKELGYPTKGPVLNRIKNKNTEEIGSYNNNTALTENLEGPRVNIRNINTSLFTNNNKRNKTNKRNNLQRITSLLRNNNRNLPLTRNIEEGPLPNINNNNISVREIEENSGNNMSNNYSSVSSESSSNVSVNMSRINYGGRRKRTRRNKRKATRHR